MRAPVTALLLVVPALLPLLPAAGAVLEGPHPFVVVIDPTNEVQMSTLHCTTESSSSNGYGSYRTVTATCPRPTIPHVGKLACSNPAVLAFGDGGGHTFVDGWASCAGSTAYCQTQGDPCWDVAHAGIDPRRDDGGDLVCTWKLSVFHWGTYRTSRALCAFGALAWPESPVDAACVEVLATEPYVHASATEPCDPEDPACVGVSFPGEVLTPKPLTCLFPDAAGAPRELS